MSPTDIAVTASDRNFQYFIFALASLAFIVGAWWHIPSFIRHCRDQAAHPVMIIFETIFAVGTLVLFLSPLSLTFPARDAYGVGEAMVMIGALLWMLAIAMIMIAAAAVKLGRLNPLG